jgi:hypothetical protein
MRKINQWPRATQRVFWLITATMFGSLGGIICAVGWGDNFRTKVLRVDGVGTFYRIASPKEIRALSDVQTADIAAPDASDFERVGVNNYWIASSENHTRVISGLPADRTLDEIVVRRNHGGALRGALNAYLEGRNFVVYEMENSGFGYCAGHFDVRLNGNSVIGVPLYAPSGPKEIMSLLMINEDPKAFHNVLCSRRIIEIDLGVQPEPFKRLLEFVGLRIH